MNAIRFVVDDNNKVLKCVYTHDIDSGKVGTIKMEPGKLNSLVKLFAEEYKSIDERIQEDVSILTFYDVEDRALREIAKISREYKQRLEKIKQKTHIEEQKQQRVIEYTCPGKYLKDKNKKVTRTKKTAKAINMSALALSTVILLTSMTSMGTKANTKNEINTPISYMQTIDNDINKEFNETNIIEQIEINENEVIEKSKNSPINPFSIETNDLTTSEKYLNAKEQYYSIIEKYSRQYGLDPMVMLAIATQERGVHSNQVDAGGGLGLFQVQIEGSWNWDNEKVTAFNYETNENETVTITKEKASELENNIKYGCMLFQNILKEQKYNIPRAIQSYNYGSTYMSKVINACCTDTGLTREDLSDPSNLTWIDYRYVIQNGDNKYLENVLRYLPNNTEITFRKPDGETITMTYENIPQEDYVI